MASIYQFKNYLQKRAVSGEITPVLLNYIHCFHPLSGQDFKASLIEDFYLRLLHDLHYRSIYKAAYHTLLDEIQPFFRKYLIEDELEEIKNIIPPQIVPIDTVQDRLSALEIWYKNHISQNDRVHILPLNNDHCLALCLKSDGRLQIFSHSSVFFLRYGKLTPLPPLSRLSYNRQFELELSKNHTLFQPPDQFCFFCLYPSHIESSAYSIKDFSPIKKLSFKNIKENEDLFFHLKNMEHHYIKATSDPFYKELVQSLQTSYQLLLGNHPHATASAKKAMDSAKKALKNFYPGDRLLILFTANIEFHLRKRMEKTMSMLESSRRSPSHSGLL